MALMKKKKANKKTLALQPDDESLEAMPKGKPKAKKRADGSYMDSKMRFMAGKGLKGC